MGEQIKKITTSMYMSFRYFLLARLKRLLHPWLDDECWLVILRCVFLALLAFEIGALAVCLL